MDEGLPVSYLALEHHVPIYDADGDEVGHVHHVVAAPEKDIFHGIVMNRHGDHFFIAADQIASMHEHGVDLSISGDAVAQLPHPSGAAPVFTDREPGAADPHPAWHKLIDLLGGKDPRERNWRKER